MGVISTQNLTYRIVAGNLPGTQLDVFQDEDLQISNNITNLFDLGILPTDFTKNITLPGTKLNNAFFEHYYDISIINPFLFSTSIKVPCYLDFNGLYLVQGYLQLNKVSVYQNKAVDSYEVTIYGALSSFARTVNTAFLTDLTNLQKYNHTSSYDNIVASWTGSLFNGDIVYPLADYGNAWNFDYNRDLQGINSNEGAMNTMDFKPSIRMKAVWDGIFEYAGFTYSSSFMAQDWINDIYMVCNHSLTYPIYSTIDLETYGQIQIGAISGSGQTDLVLTDNAVQQLPWYSVQSDPQGFVGVNSSYRVEVASKLEGTLSLAVNVSGSLNNMPDNWAIYYWPTGSTPTGAGSGYSVIPNFNSYFDQLVVSRTGGVNQTYNISTDYYTSVLQPGEYYFGLYQKKYYSSGAGTPRVTIDPGGNPKSFLTISKVRQAADGLIMDIPSNMPFGTKGIKLIDFLTSVQKKFNLVIYPDNTKPNNFIIETFNNWYKKGKVVSFDNFIDLNQKIDVIPANNLAVNNLSFGDTLDADYISQQFNKGANREYGKAYYVDTQNYFSSGKFDVATGFASTPLYYITGTGLSGSVDGINPGAPVYQWALGGQGYNYNSNTDACSGVYYYPATVYTAESNAFDITQFFTDPALTTPFQGTGYYYKFYKVGGGATYYSTDITYGGYPGAAIYQC
jgi:hypothetical protein